jgi:hypothetical protein
MGHILYVQFSLMNRVFTTCFSSLMKQISANAHSPLRLAPTPPETIVSPFHKGLPTSSVGLSVTVNWACS